MDRCEDVSSSLLCGSSHTLDRRDEESFVSCPFLEEKGRRIGIRGIALFARWESKLALDRCA